MAASIWNPGGQQQVPALPAVAPVSFVKGTVGNPGINFVGDTDTGIWSESDGYLNFVVNGVTQLRIDPQGNITANKFSGGVELDIASAAVTDIGAVLSNSVRVTGTNAISSFGTTYRGPMFVRFASALTLTYNATTLITPGAATISINAGDSIVVTPKATAGVADGWVVVSYTSGSPNLNAVTSINNGQLRGLGNRIINGDMRISQRNGTTSTAIGSTAASAYCIDRWQVYRTAGVSGGTTTQALMGVTGAPERFLQVQRNPGDTSTATITAATSLETANIRDLQGKQVTLSFWLATVGAATANGVVATISQGTGTDGNNFTGLTGYSVVAAQSFSAVSWTRYSITGTISNSATQIGVTFSWPPSGTAGVGDYFGITGVQLEIGSVATPFEQRPIGMELALCQRYFEKSFPQSIAPASSAGTSGASSFSQPVGASLAVYGWAVQYKVTKRVAPTVVGYNPSAAGGQIYNDIVGATCTSSSVEAISSDSGFVLQFTTAAGSSAGQSNLLQWTASAEL